VSVHIGVHQATARVGVPLGHGRAGQVGQHFEKGVGFADADGQADPVVLDVEATFQVGSGAFRQVVGPTPFDGPERPGHGPDVGDGRAAGRKLFVVEQRRPVHGVGNVGQDGSRHTVVGQDVFQVAQVGRRDEARHDVHPAMRRGLFPHELAGQGGHGRVPAFHMGAGIARGGDVDDFRQGQGAELLAELGQKPGHVIPDGLGQAGGGHAHDRGPVLGHDVQDAFFEIRAAAEHGLLFPEGRGGDVHGLAEMADDVAAHVGGAALAAVQVGDGPLHALEGQGGAQRRAQLAGVGGGDVGGIAHDLSPATSRLSASARALAAASRRGTNRHTGLVAEAWTSLAKLSMPIKPSRASLRSWLWSQKPTPSLWAMGRSLTPPTKRSTSSSRTYFDSSSGLESSTMTVPGSQMAASSS